MKVLRNIRNELEPTTSAVLAAHEADGREALESVDWERHGVLGRLRRLDLGPAEAEISDDSVAA
jgi:hypothetical protein